MQSGNNLTGIAVQFATQDQKNATQVQKRIAIFNIKISYYAVLLIPLSSKLEFVVMQNFESKLFPGCNVIGHCHNYVHTRTMYNVPPVSITALFCKTSVC